MTISRSDAIHLLRRSGYVVTSAGVTDLMGAADWTAAVDRVLDVRAVPNPAPPAALSDSSLADWQRGIAVGEWWMEIMRTSACPIVDKLAFFFHGHHFVCGLSKSPNAKLAFDHIRMLRTHAMGDYHQLAQAVAVDPWMLHYLDNGVNKAPSRINENFGRELLELFLLGNGQYTEADVVAMSRAWSGHNLAADKVTYVFDPAAHDNGNKTLFGITKNWDGPGAITEVLKGVKAVPASRHLVTKLWRHLVGTAPSGAVVDALAAGFRSSGLAIAPLVRSIFLRPEFRSAEARVALVRSPVEWFVAMVGALDLTTTGSHPAWFLPDMGQMPLNPPNVAGWGYNADWLTSGRWWRRGDCASYLRWVATSPPYSRFSQIGSGTAPSVVADTILPAFGILEPSTATRRSIVDHAADVGRGWYGWSTRTHSMILASLSPEFVVG